MKTSNITISIISHDTYHLLYHSCHITAFVLLQKNLHKKEENT